MSDENKAKIDLGQLRIDRDSSREPVGGKMLKASLWIAIPIALILIVVLLLGSISSPVSVKLGTVTRLTQTQAQSVLSATGYVVAERKAAVASKATGRLEYLGVEEGDTVKQGQVIGRIENADMIAALDLAKANLEQARAESTEAALDYNRQKQLFENASISQAAFEISQARYLSAVAGVKSAAAAVRAAEVSLENTYIRAPFDGTVLTKHADVGEVVAPFASSASSKGSVVDLADMSSLEVEADVSEANIQRVSVNQACEIILDAYPEIRYKGIVKKIVPTADRSRATVMTKVAFTEIDTRVLPEMSARVNFFGSDTQQTEMSSEPVIAIPSAALINRDGRQVVFTVANDKAKELVIETGKKIGSMIEVKSGVSAGQKVVLSPAADLKDGDKVKIVE